MSASLGDGVSASPGEGAKGTVSLTSPTQAEIVPVLEGRVGAAFDNLLQLNSQAPCRLAFIRPEAKCKGREPEAVKNPFQSSSESVISQLKKKCLQRLQLQ